MRASTMLLCMCGLAFGGDRDSVVSHQGACQSDLCQNAMSGIVDCGGDQDCEAHVFVEAVWEMDMGSTAVEHVQDITWYRSVITQPGEPCDDELSVNENLISTADALWVPCSDSPSPSVPNAGWQGSGVCAYDGPVADPGSSMSECLTNCYFNSAVCSNCCDSVSCDPCAGQPCIDGDCNQCESPNIQLSDCETCHTTCLGKNTRCSLICINQFSDEIDDEILNRINVATNP